MDYIQYHINRHLDIIIAIIFTTALTIVVVKFNIFATIDGDIHLSWIYFWNRQIAEGQFYPQWFEAAFNGLGTTSFIFYPPLMRLISIPFGLLNLSPTEQVKGTIIFILLIHAYGVIKVTRLLFNSNKIYILLAVSIAIVNPFLMNEIFKRGGFPSICFICLIPYLLVGINNYLEKPNYFNFVCIVFINSIIFLTHIPSCLIFVSAYIPSLFILFILSDKKLKVITFNLGLGTLIGLAVDAFFVLPILFDMHLVYQAFLPNINTIEDRLYSINIFNSNFSFFPKGIEHNIAKIFLFNTTLFIFTVFAIYPWKKLSNKTFVLYLQILIVGFCLLMNTSITYPVYDRIETFRKLQFPWRYLGFTTALIPYLICYALENLSHTISCLRKKIVAIVIIVSIFLINYKTASFFLRTKTADSFFINQVLTNNRIEAIQSIPSTVKLEPLGEGYYHLSLAKKGAPIFFLNRDKYYFPGDVIDYVPKTSAVQSKWLSFRLSNNKTIQLPQEYPNIEFIKGQGDFTIKQWRGGKRIFDLQINQEAILNLKTFYYPGWKIELTPNLNSKNQQEIISPAQDGRIQLKMPRGIYSVKIFYQGTKAERAGFFISLGTVLILFLILISRNLKFISFLST